MEETMRRTLRSAIWIAGLTSRLGLTVGAVSHAGRAPTIPLDKFEALDPANKDVDVEQAAEDGKQLAALVVAAIRLGEDVHANDPAGLERAVFGRKGAGADVGVEPRTEVGDSSPAITNPLGGSCGVDPLRRSELTNGDQALLAE